MSAIAVKAGVAAMAALAVTVAGAQSRAEEQRQRTLGSWAGESKMAWSTGEPKTLYQWNGMMAARLGPDGSVELRAGNGCSVASRLETSVRTFVQPKVRVSGCPEASGMNGDYSWSARVQKERDGSERLVIWLSAAGGGDGIRPTEVWSIRGSLQRQGS